MSCIEDVLLFFFFLKKKPVYKGGTRFQQFRASTRSHERQHACAREECTFLAHSSRVWKLLAITAAARLCRMDFEISCFFNKI
jgi:hypothetical protein